MNTRIDELLRQRELMRDHLRWLEKEIASEQGETSTLAPEASKPVDHACEGTSTGNQLGTAIAASTVSEPPEFFAPVPEPDAKSLHNEVKSGCLIYAAILFGGLALLIGFIYWKY